MTIRVAINGYGDRPQYPSRALRVREITSVEIVAINDLAALRPTHTSRARHQVRALCRKSKPPEMQ
jgi:glyceraldehyde-3-phosphate dehydrogenase/erythrose-4-phosphate dehydrogenase